ncbi:MAG: hypothetical protein IPJ19_14805 [Planctomycetes bacterium]|nr:hypothetical protein [Planctomycetota bacterium]
MKPRQERTRDSLARLAWLPGAFLVACAVLAGGACLVAPPLRVAPVAPEATAALERAVEHQRERGLPGHEDASAREREELERALERAPGWVAPQRLLDDLERDELRGAEALERERAKLERDPGDAGTLYLAGRLEGSAGRGRFELALRADPNLAWAHNGLAWSAGSEQHLQEALVHARAALARARDSYERGYFVAALARLEFAAGDHDQAFVRLEARLAAPEAPAAERVALRVLRASRLLQSSRSERVREGYDEGLQLLGTEPLAEAEVSALAALLRAASLGEPSRLLELASALARRSSPARDRERARSLLESGPTPLALGLLERAQATAGGAAQTALLRRARFAAGEGPQAVERWLAELPAGARAPDGLPRDERLRAVVRAARALGATAAPSEALGRFADALCDAGWFAEAREVAGALARTDLERALALDARSLAALSAFSGLRRVLLEADRERSGAALLADLGVPSSDSGALLRAARAPIRDLDGLLARFDALLAPTRPAGALAGFVDSPRLSFGFVGQLVHPGPRFSKADEQADLGREGAPVPGLAADLLRLHRFGIFGEMRGAGPDGALLPLLALEWRSGTHLGVPWAGTVALCESADLEPQAARLGAGIAGAALHEGYWLDVDTLRGEQAHWRALAHEYGGEAGTARRAQLLEFRGFELRAHDEEELSRMRRASGALLGEGDRVRLARLASGGLPGLDELVDVAGTHEEGHLCDRTRFLPLARHLPRALGFFLDCGGSPQRVMEMLEYRAQLIALCDAQDPRLPLAQVLDAAEGDLGSSLTPHAAGYARVLADLLGVLDRELVRDAAAYPQLDPARTLAQQMHRLGPEQVRACALLLARRKGLDRS